MHADMGPVAHRRLACDEPRRMRSGRLHFPARPRFGCAGRRGVPIAAAQRTRRSAPGRGARRTHVPPVRAKCGRPVDPNASAPSGERDAPSFTALSASIASMLRAAGLPAEARRALL